MRRILIVVFAALSLAIAVAASAQDEPVSFDGSRAHVYKSAPGRSLSATSKAAPTRWWASSWAAKAWTPRPWHHYGLLTNTESATRLTHVRMEQQVAGLRVVDAYVKATINGREKWCT